MAITFQIQKIEFTLRNKTALRSWIKKVAALEKKIPGQINYVFMNDVDLLKHNNKFLSHDTFTDIITFDYSHDKTISGDILISIDRVTENAKKFGEEFEKELRRVMIHGVLHLCGYSDKSKAAKEEMRKKEDWALKKF